MFSRRFPAKSIITMSSSRFSSTLTPIKTANAPPPAASYSQAMKANGFIYVSGQIPYTPQNTPIKGPISIQTEQVLTNISHILQAANSSMDKIIKVNIFLNDINDFNEFNSVYGEWFKNHKPARSCVAVEGLPLGVELEVEVIAVEL